MQVKSTAMLQEEHSAILSTFINLPFVIKIFVLSIFEWPFYIICNCKLGFQNKIELPSLMAKSVDSDDMLQNASHLVMHLLSKG